MGRKVREMDINIDYKHRTALIDNIDHNGQQYPILLEIDLEDQEITAYIHRNLGTWTQRVQDRKSYRYLLVNAVNAAALADWVRTDILPLADRMLAGYSTHYNGCRYVGTLNEDAQEASEEIRTLCEDDRAVPTIKDDGGLRSVTEWANIDEITADTTDAEIDRLTDEINRIADQDDVVLYGRQDVREYLTERRAELQDDA